MTRDLLCCVAAMLALAGGALGADAPGAATQPARELTLDLGDKVTLKLVLIPAGRFLMGSPETEKDRGKDEVQHEVTISKPFYLGVYEVTVDQYALFVKETGTKHEEPKFKQAGDHPVVNVSWDDAQAFCRWLSKKAGKMVVLPTEAQWEYACRAGTKTRFSFGDKDEDLGDHAWHDGNSKGKGAKMTHPVGQKKPNAWGLYDMHGNVWEWCADFYGDYAGAGADPTGPERGGLRLVRGGCWDIYPAFCRSAVRNGIVAANRRDIYGFRVAVSAEAVDVP